jgi:hypothetical protein
MIIGINGKIGSGKDTVGKIIQWITSEELRNVWLNDVHSFLEDKKHHYDNEQFSIWKIKKFAAKLKEIASLITGIPVEYFEDQEFKKTYLGEEWDKKTFNPFGKKSDYIVEKMQVRSFLQKLGTEAMRDGLHTNVWVNALFADYKVEIKEITNKSYTKKEDKWVHKWGGKEILSDNQNFSFKKYNYPKWIITDMRFPNEIAAVELREGITIRVVRPETKDYFQLKNRDGSITHATLHPSETSLDSAEFDYEIINSGTIEDLVEKVREILIKEEII